MRLNMTSGVCGNSHTALEMSHGSVLGNSHAKFTLLLSHKETTESEVILLHAHALFCSDRPSPLIERHGLESEAGMAVVH